MGLNLDALKKIAIENLEGALGHLTGGADPLTRETALAELEAFFERNGEAITGASVDFIIELLDFAVSGDETAEGLLDRIAEATADDIAEMAEATADEVEAITAGILEGRKQLLDDVRDVLSQLARGALAAALAGLAGLA